MALDTAPLTTATPSRMAPDLRPAPSRSGRAAKRLLRRIPVWIVFPRRRAPI